MGAAREKEQADFDLERFIDMFDEALTSNDERVISALRSLMMMVILTKPEGRKVGAIGPLRQMYDDIHNINSRLNNVEDRLHRADEYAYRHNNVWPKDKYQWSKIYSSGLDEIDVAAYNRTLTQTLNKINSPKGK
jgi:hypothetical protein